MASVHDVSRHFTPKAIGIGLGRIWTVDGQFMVPSVDIRGVSAECPITCEMFKDPVLLDDGFVYERDAILQWLGSNSSAPCTNTMLRHKDVLKLVPYKEAFEAFLAKSILPPSRPRRSCASTRKRRRSRW